MRELMKGQSSGYKFEEIVWKELFHSGNFCLHRNLFLYVEETKRFTEIDLVIAFRNTYYCVELKAYKNLISGRMESNSWVGVTGTNSTVFQNPFKQNNTHKKALANYLEKAGIKNAKVIGVVVAPDRTVIRGNNSVIKAFDFINKMKEYRDIYLECDKDFLKYNSMNKELLEKFESVTLLKKEEILKWKRK